MIQRENFYSLLINTLITYYQEVFHDKLSISITNKKTDILIFENLGSIHKRHSNSKIFKYWMNEYNIRNKPIKYLVAKIYVISCFLFKDLLAQKYLQISPSGLFHDSIAIIPANRKIRIFDFKNNYVDAIVKDGFTSKFFNNEVDFRLKTQYSFVPKIINHGKNWYREEILKGKPLARIKNNSLYTQSLNKINSYLAQINLDTVQEVDNHEYINSIYQRLVKKLARANNEKNIRYYNEISNIIEVLKNITLGRNYQINIVLSHGDLQSGNIWVETNGEVKILDWETHSIRSEWYDKLIVERSLRRSKKLKELIDDVRRNIKIVDFEDQIYVVALFCLEDLEFYLDDLLELPKDFGNKIFDRVSREFILMGWESEKIK